MERHNFIKMNSFHIFGVHIRSHPLRDVFPQIWFFSQSLLSPLRLLIKSQAQSPWAAKAESLNSTLSAAAARSNVSAVPSGGGSICRREVCWMLHITFLFVSVGIWALAFFFPGFSSVQISLPFSQIQMKLGLQILPSGDQRVSDEKAVGICRMTQKGQPPAHPSGMTKDSEEGDCCPAKGAAQPVESGALL